jgi:uncharacterized protein YkwD
VGSIMMRMAVVGIVATLALSAASVAQDSSETGEETTQRAVVDTATMQGIRDRALAMGNEARAEHGLGALQVGEALNKAAQEHAEDMLDRDYYSHISPDGQTVEDRYQEQGGSRWNRVAENIGICKGCAPPPALETIERFQEGWMKSPDHRRNILMEGLETFGFGIAGDKDRLYAVQTFAGPGMPLALKPGEEPVALSASEQIDRAVEALNRARERGGVDGLAHSTALSEVARKLLARSSADHLIDPPDDPFALLPRDAASSWERLYVVAAACDGCGARPTAADIRYFTDQWSKGDGQTALRGKVSHIGFAMQANGEGHKVAVAVFGEPRAE